MTVFMGDDWAEDHHDVHLMNDDGKKLASRRLPEGLDGIRVFHELVADHVSDPGEVIVGIETDRGLWVTALVAAGYQVYAIKPLAATRSRSPSIATRTSSRASTGTPPTSSHNSSCPDQVELKPVEPNASGGLRPVGDRCWRASAVR